MGDRRGVLLELDREYIMTSWGGGVCVWCQQDFKNSGLPWRGEQCRSVVAGTSGVLYAMGAFVCPSYWEKALWICQAVRFPCFPMNLLHVMCH